MINGMVQDTVHFSVPLEELPEMGDRARVSDAATLRTILLDNRAILCDFNK